MFARRYYPGRYWTRRYWPAGGTAPPPPVDVRYLILKTLGLGKFYVWRTPA